MFLLCGGGMSATLVGLILSLVFIVQIIWYTVSDLRVFNDIPGFLLIIGSTVSVALCIYTGKDTAQIFKLMLQTLRPHKETNPETVSEIINLAKDTDGELKRLESFLPTVHHPFLREGVQLIIDRFQFDHIEEIMSMRIRKAREDQVHRINSVKTLAKYPPAFGIMACVIGLISVMQKLGGTLGPGELAPSMAVALVGTLIGLITSNFIIMPMGENLQVKWANNQRDLKIIKTGVLLLAMREPTLVIQEKLNSYLDEDKRVDLIGAGGSGAGEGRRAA
jgi:chemotaxis protein MotA